MAATTVQLPKLLSTAQVAEYLGIPINTVYQLNCKGVGPKRIRVGRHLRYRASDLDAWLERQVAS